MKNVLLIFIDGLGLGSDDPGVNPLVRFDPPVFRRLFGKPLTQSLGYTMSEIAALVPTDASMGVVGLPQSATGQTALFTGVNAPAVLQGHVVGFPGPTLARIIAEHGIMAELAAEGFQVTSANMYTPNYMDLVASRKRRHSASTLTILGSGVKLRSLEEMQAGEAVYQDITNEILPDFGFDGIPMVSPRAAGERLASLAARYHFTLFEYFQTDRIGHKHDWILAEKIATNLDGFLDGVISAKNEETLVVVTSDHGNFEDLGVKTHTHNPVPTIIIGPGFRKVAGQIKRLTDIKPALMAYIREGEQG